MNSWDPDRIVDDQPEIQIAALQAGNELNGAHPSEDQFDVRPVPSKDLEYGRQTIGEHGFGHTDDQSSCWILTASRDCSRFLYQPQNAFSIWEERLSLSCQTHL